MPTEGDGRYTVQLEFTGNYTMYLTYSDLKPGQAWVARWLGEWIGSAPTEQEARDMADEHDDVRMRR